MNYGIMLTAARTNCLNYEFARTAKIFATS